jgi:hypothetical protein
MRRILRILVGCLCLILCLSAPCFAKEWRGIVPLHTTRAEVIKLLGEPKPSWELADWYFDLGDSRVEIEWIDPTCERKYPIRTSEGGSRPDDLVLNIAVIEKKPIPSKELNLSPGTIYYLECFGKNCTSIDINGGFSFRWTKEGVTFHSYGPATKEFKAWLEVHKGCQAIRDH